MRWLVTGAGGQLGHHLLAQLTGEQVIGLTRAELDVTSADAVEDAIANYRPDILINAAAYTAVDRAESEPDLAAATNVEGPRSLATALARHGGRLIHVSTDYVFDGTAARPYEPDDPVAPRSVYGRTKYEGELAVRAALPEHAHVVRTAWVYGGPGRNFVDAMLARAAARGPVEVVSDQVGSPTWASELADALVALGRSGLPGTTMHFANTGQVSRFDFARTIFDLVGADPQRVVPVRTASRAAAAMRPAWSVLSSASWTTSGLPTPNPWRSALERYLTVRGAGLSASGRERPPHRP